MYREATSSTSRRAGSSHVLSLSHCFRIKENVEVGIWVLHDLPSNKVHVLLCQPP